MVGILVAVIVLVMSVQRGFNEVIKGLESIDAKLKKSPPS
jgi:hypothetical protein